MTGYTYILECSDKSYYTGSTNNLELRIIQHETGFGANYTKKRLPVKLIYFEEYPRIDEAFYREKQIQGWSRKKKEALITGDFDKLSHLATSVTKPNPEPAEGCELTDKNRTFRSLRTVLQAHCPAQGTVTEAATSVTEPATSVTEPAEVTVRCE